MMFVLFGRVTSAFGRAKKVNRTLFSDKYLFVTNVILSATLTGVGDAIEQKRIFFREMKEAKEEKRHFDWDRSRNMCIAGVTVGILTHKWYSWLDRKFPGRTTHIVLYKVLLDTVVFSPMQIVTFFTTMGLVERSPPREVWEEIYSKGRILYLFEWMVWAPLQVLNFYFLPSKYRVLYDNSFSLIYDVFVSYVKFDRPPELDEKNGKWFPAVWSPR